VQEKPDNSTKTFLVLVISINFDVAPTSKLHPFKQTAGIKVARPVAMITVMFVHSWPALVQPEMPIHSWASKILNAMAHDEIN
jgi:hypothetical protein